jgi:hypothetical protein
MIQLLVVDVEGRTIEPIGRPLPAHYMSPLEQDWAWWPDAGETVWWLRESRGATRLQLLAAEPPGWQERVVLEEFDQHGYVQPHELHFWRSQTGHLVRTSCCGWPSAPRAGRTFICTTHGRAR